jgi:hypothetical protein
MSAVSLLSHLASSAVLLRSADARFCAQVPVGDRLEIYKLKSAAFRHGSRLTRNASKRIAASAGWPKTPTMFSQQLRRLAPRLHLQGTCIAFERRKDGQYISVNCEPAPVSKQTPPTADPVTIQYGRARLA